MLVKLVWPAWFNWFGWSTSSCWYASNAGMLLTKLVHAGLCWSRMVKLVCQNHGHHFHISQHALFQYMFCLLCFCMYIDWFINESYATQRDITYMFLNESSWILLRPLLKRLFQFRWFRSSLSFHFLPLAVILHLACEWIQVTIVGYPHSGWIPIGIKHHFASQQDVTCRPDVATVLGKN
jgi:hypothetical protein